MSSDNQQVLYGWGNYPGARCRVRAPQSPRDLSGQIATGGTVARGHGRSYGDPALNESRTVIDCRAMDRYVSFDEATGTLVCEAGVSLAQIIADFAPRGFFPMVTPGTKFVTVGGCIANDVHGKAHHVDGCFSRCVDAFTILLADGSTKTATRTQNEDLFWGNFGGMGLLGIITTVTLRLRPIETTWFHQEAVVADNLDMMLDALDAHDATHPYSVAWVDPAATGRNLGRGVLTVGDHVALADLPTKLKDKALLVSPPPKIQIPFHLPSFSLNRVTARPLNMVMGMALRHGAAIAHYEKFFYPLDFIGDWNRGYGRRGFTQYQFVIPLKDGRQRIRALLERITSSDQIPFLNVLKKFGHEEPENVLSFPFEGYTFAIDFPIRDGLGDFLRELDGMVLDAGGRVYLGKDAFLDRPTFEAMYANKLAAWRNVKNRYDPSNTFSSNLGRRVGLCA